MEKRIDKDRRIEDKVKESKWTFVMTCNKSELRFSTDGLTPFFKQSKPHEIPKWKMLQLNQTNHGEWLKRWTNVKVKTKCKK